MAAIDQRLARVVAVSAAAETMTPVMLAEIVRVSRHNNLTARLSGMLLCVEGEFLHLLEGAAGEVDDALTRIGGDGRNRWLTVLSRERPFFRAFKDWSVGCVHLDGLKDEHGLPEDLVFEPSWANVKRRLPMDRSLEFYRLLERFCEVEKGRRVTAAGGARESL